ncbi:MAG TPA: hypothetical protein EYQ66_08090, partial [Myxococcales bacterium]|nr:hypothetical protein [Myxococcales bacterium]
MIRSLSLRDIALRTFALLLGAQLLSPGRVWAAPPDPEASAMRPDYSSQVILDSIGQLEAESDAKCNSTASRFEDFLFGTPLSESARIEKTELQKALVRRLWYAASDKARAKGHSGVTAEHLQEETRSILTESEAPDGTLRVQFPNHPP